MVQTHTDGSSKMIHSCLHYAIRQGNQDLKNRLCNRLVSDKPIWYMIETATQ